MNYDLFKNKKILIFMPHQDDEINVVGGLLIGLKNIKCEVKIVYSTNGDYFTSNENRIKESLKALKILGVKKDNLIYLGYSDQYSNNSDHIYMEEKVWKSVKGNTKTHTFDDRDYHYLKFGEHCEFNKHNLISDIYQIIIDNMPDIIICIDYDSHSDHRALSLSFEHALGKVLKKFDYSPIVFKGFAYPTAYLGYKDFKNNKLLKTRFNKEKHSVYPCQNPYYKWEDRISMDTGKNAKRKLLILNPLFRAMTKYRSQFILNNAYSIINADNVFFERRTDNLLYKSEVKTSSGNSQYLNDFLLFDSTNIMYGDSKSELLDAGITKFDVEDNKKEILVNFTKKTVINTIKIYQDVNMSEKIKSVSIIFNNQEKKYQILNDNFIYVLDNLNIETKNLKIKFNDFDNKELGITEIEMFKDSSRKYIVSNYNEDKSKINLLNKLIFLLDDLTILSYRIINKIIRKIRKK